MKIDTTIKTAPAAGAKTPRPAAGRARTGAPSGPAVSDEVRLTSTSGRMRQLEAELAQLDIDDPGKVESVRQAIDQGRFAVNEEAVAEKLIQEAIDHIAHHARP